jgi:formylglycine-generating enzyme required for sulfatase activity
MAWVFAIVRSNFAMPQQSMNLACIFGISRRLGLPRWMILGCGLLALTGALRAGERVALVIGNGHYDNLAEGLQLTSPMADAADVAAQLKGLGYTVITGGAVINAPRQTMISATETFVAKAHGADAAIFYYSGHGIQIGDENFLMARDTPALTSYASLRNHNVSLRESVMSALEETGVPTKVIILDCCRDNPFSTQLERALNQLGKSVKTKGLGEISGYGSGFYLAFATSPGSQALDGNGARNSPFTAAMLKTLPGSANKDIDFFFRDVKRLLGRDQVSWTNHSLSADFSLATLTTSGAPPSLPSLPSGPSTAAPPQAAPVVENPRIGSTPGERLEVEIGSGVTMAFRWCPAGSFTMGSPAAEKKVLKKAGAELAQYASEVQHNVTLTRGFWMAETELTQAQWQAVMGTNLVDQANKMLDDDETYDLQGQKQTLRNWMGAQKGEGASRVYNQEGDIPMYYVSWNEEVEFCAKATQAVSAKIPGMELRLPTEAEWEYACRAGTKTMTFAGDFTIKGVNNAPGLDGIAWYGGNCSVGYEGVGLMTDGWKEKQYPGGNGGPRRVAAKQANPWGLYDVIGNLWEWRQDYYGPYPHGAAIDPRGPGSGVDRVDRGGTWYYFARNCRAASRDPNKPGIRLNDLGFRVALAPTR